MSPKVSDYPNLLKEWDFEKNVLNPYEVKHKSSKKVWWICKNNHSWKAIVHSRTNKHQCPFCSGLKVEEKNSFYFNENMDKWNYEKNIIDPKTISLGSDKKVWWICKNNHSWKTSVKHIVNGSGCPYCSGKKVGYGNSFAEKNPKLLKEWNDKNIVSPYSITSGSSKKVWWICKNNHSWKACIKDRTNGQGCPKCSNRISKTASKWLDTLEVKERERYINVNGKKLFVDGIDGNKVYEYFGNFWHGNPEKYNPEDIHPIIKKSFGTLYKETLEKIKVLEKAGFEVIYKWGT